MDAEELREGMDAAELRDEAWREEKDRWWRRSRKRVRWGGEWELEEAARFSTAWAGLQRKLYITTVIWVDWKDKNASPVGRNNTRCHRLDPGHPAKQSDEHHCSRAGKALIPAWIKNWDDDHKRGIGNTQPRLKTKQHILLVVYMRTETTLRHFLHIYTYSPAKQRMLGAP